MRIFIISMISLVAVIITALVFFDLLDYPVILEQQSEQPNIVFIDKADLYTQACITARNNFSNYSKQAANTCQTDNDCRLYGSRSLYFRGIPVNSDGLKELVRLENEISENCVLNVQLTTYNIHLYGPKIFHNYQSNCLNQQCINMPDVNEPELNRFIHNSFNKLQNQTH